MANLSDCITKIKYQDYSEIANKDVAPFVGQFWAELRWKPPVLMPQVLTGHPAPSLLKL